MSPKKVKKEIKSIRDDLVNTVTLMIIDKRYLQNEAYLKNSVYQMGIIQDRLDDLYESIEDDHE